MDPDDYDYEDGYEYFFKEPASSELFDEASTEEYDRTELEDVADVNYLEIYLQHGILTKFGETDEEFYDTHGEDINGY